MSKSSDNKIITLSEDNQDDMEFLSPEGMGAAEGFIKGEAPAGKHGNKNKKKRAPLNLPKPLRAVLNFLKPVGAWLGRHPFYGIILLSFCMNLFIETCARHSLIRGFEFLFSSPIIFLYNVIVILMTYSIALLLRHKSVWILLASIIWAGLGIANGAILGTRVTPLTATDIKVLDSGIQLMNLYLTKFQIVLIGFAIIAAVAAMIVVSIKSKKRKVNYLKSGAAVIACILLFAGSTTGLIKIGVLQTVFPNIADAYMEYGFVFCFYRGIFDSGVDKPADYSDDAVKEVLADISADKDSVPTETPNIIIVQLESFFDVNRMADFKYSENPIPAFSWLKEHYSSGFLTVPSIGAGTANTEFEVLTGMNLKYFGTGEIPFKTILQDHTCESIAYNLKELGYSTHGIHNHSGDFYSRHLVYGNLGFDTFTSAEYIKNVVRNPLDWMKDSVLTGEIEKCLDSSAARDLVFTVSVQGHGKYPSEQIDPTQTITIKSGIDDDEERKAGFEYYINQLNEMDEFVSDLVVALSNRDEPCVLVLYGDHFPSLGVENDQLSDGNKFQTDYIIWSNFDMPVTHDDVNAYQLSAYLLNKFNINNGVFTKLNQNYTENNDYQDALELFEYDMLYGEKTMFNKQNPFKPVEIHYGVDEVTFSSATNATETDDIVLKGENFTERSMIYINGDRKSTDYINETTLVMHEAQLELGDRIKVCQVTKSGKILSETNELIYDTLTRLPELEASGDYPVLKKPYELLPPSEWPTPDEIMRDEAEEQAARDALTYYTTTTTTSASEPIPPQQQLMH